MKTRLLKDCGVVGMAGLYLLLGMDANAAQPAKIALCHVPPGNPANTQLINVGGNAHAAHMEHGDWLATAAMCDDIPDNNCDGSTDGQVADDAACVSSNGMGYTCENSQCVAPPPLARLGDRVWEDLDADGIQDCTDTNGNGILGDAGDMGPECNAGIPNLPVNLLAGDCSIPLGQTAMTDADGFYLFPGLAPGDYCVEFELPGEDFCDTDGFDLGGPRFTLQHQANSIVDSDANSTTGISDSITLGNHDDFTIDAGIVCPAKIGDRVFLDDGNGIQDGGEPGIEGVEVNLFACGPDGMAGTGDDIDLMQSRTTDANGLYMFGSEPGVYDLAPGNYYVQFEQPNGLEFTLPKQGGDDATDSDCLAPSGRTACTGDLSSRGINLNRDCGLVAPPLECDLTLNKTCVISEQPPMNFPTADSCSFNTASANVTYGYTVTNNGDPITGVIVTDDQLGVIGGPGALGNGDSAQFTSMTTISGTTTNVATATGSLANGADCMAMDSLTVEQVIPPGSCDDGKPESLVFEYTGETCAASDNMQGDKAKCSGDPVGAAPVTILYMGLNGNKIGVFPGGETIGLGDLLTLDAFGQDRLEANSKLEITQGGATLQSLEIHTSCSQPLNEGDQFGSLILRVYVPEN